MSKNMTRKGLAIGAGLSLAMTGLVASPANATSVATAVHLGTIANTLVGGTNEIDLATQMSIDLNGGLETALKYRVLNPTGAPLSFSVSNNGTAAAVGNSLAAGDNVDSYYSSATGAAITATSVTSTDFVVVPGNFGAGVPGEATAFNILRVSTTSDVSVSVTIQAFIDSVSPSSHSMDTLDVKGNSFVVNFYEADDVTWTTTLDTPVPKATTLNATVVSSPALNGNYITAPNIAFTRQDSTRAIVAASTWSDVTSSWRNTAAVALDSGNWFGMPNIFQTASVGAHAATKSLFTVSTNADLAVGDVVSTIGHTSATNDEANVAVEAPNTATTFTIVTTDGVAQAAAGGYVKVQSRIMSKVSATTTTATITTLGKHKLRVGDRVTVNAADNAFDATDVTVTGVPSETTFTFAFTTALAAAVTEKNDAGSVTYVSYNQVVPGTYTARATNDNQAAWDGGTGVALSATSSAGAVALAADSVKVQTTGSANLQGINKAGAAGTIAVKLGTLSVPVKVQVLDKAGAAVGAGRAVSVTINSVGGTTKVDDRTSGTFIKTTDATGQITLTATTNAGIDADAASVSVTAEGVANGSFALDWQATSYSLIDFGVSADSLATSDRTIVSGSSYELDLAVVDQWFQAAPSASWRITASGSGVTEGALSLTSGRAKVTVKDNGLNAVSFQTVIKTQRLVSGVWTDQSTATITNKLAPASVAVNLAADGSTVYGTAADLSDAVAKVALVELDQRQTLSDAPGYVNAVTISGEVANKATLAAIDEPVVTISGPTNILFNNGKVWKRGSITVKADNNGRFTVDLYSTTAQTDTVITVASLGATATTKVTFTGIGVGEGTALTVDTPANVRPASTFQVKAKLADVYGNGVEATAGRIKVTYTGPGIVFGTLPDKTDKNGELMFSVLLGSNDTGNVVVTVSYDQNGDADYVDAKDLNTTKTVAVGTGAASGAGKVNVGSFNGKLVVYASGLSGKTISWKVGGKWGKAVASSNYAVFNRPTPVAGATVSVEIYVDGVKTLTKSVVTR